MTTPKFRCHNCGHWCNPVDFGWICSKRGGCGTEWQTEEDVQQFTEFFEERPESFYWTT